MIRAYSEKEDQRIPKVEPIATVKKHHVKKNIANVLMRVYHAQSSAGVTDALTADLIGLFISIFTTLPLYKLLFWLDLSASYWLLKYSSFSELNAWTIFSGEDMHFTNDVIFKDWWNRKGVGACFLTWSSLSCTILSNIATAPSTLYSIFLPKLLYSTALVRRSSAWTIYRSAYSAYKVFPNQIYCHLLCCFWNVYPNHKTRYYISGSMPKHRGSWISQKI